MRIEHLNFRPVIRDRKISNSNHQSRIRFCFCGLKIKTAYRQTHRQRVSYRYLCPSTIAPSCMYVPLGSLHVARLSLWLLVPPPISSYGSYGLVDRVGAVAINCVQLHIRTARKISHNHHGMLKRITAIVRKSRMNNVYHPAENTPSHLNQPEQNTGILLASLNCF